VTVVTWTCEDNHLLQRWE